MAYFEPLGGETGEKDLVGEEKQEKKVQWQS